jgi:hypothetical protein
VRWHASKVCDALSKVCVAQYARSKVVKYELSDAFCLCASMCGGMLCAYFTSKVCALVKYALSKVCAV